MISGVVLAAGTSSRLGRPKQVLPLGDRPVLQHVVDAAAEAGLGEILVVVGHAAEDVEAALRLPPAARTLRCPDYEAGQSASLRAGLRAADRSSEAAVVLLGDQPTVSPEAVELVVDAYAKTGGPVVQARYAGRPGHPVVLGRAVWQAVEAVEGDRGARDVIAEHPDWVVTVDVAGEPPPDLDTWEDYERLTEGRDGPPPP